MEGTQHLQAALDALLREVGFDRRTVHVRLQCAGSPPVVLESSEVHILEHVLPRLRRAAGGLAVEQRRLPLPSLIGQSAWVTASVADVRAQPQHTAEQVTQALQGEALQPLLHESGWVLARCCDGYIGWVRDWHVKMCASDTVRAFATRCDARVRVGWVPLRSDASPGANPCGEALMGTEVVVLEARQDWRLVELPGERCGWLPASTLHTSRDAWPATPEAVLETLAQFVGVPYVWGGKSPKGFDCSGLVQFVFGLHGVSLPRDANQQVECGQPAATPGPGDLLFFGRDEVTHVGVCAGPERFLHARGEVRYNSLRTGDLLHNPELAALYHGARRVLPQNVSTANEEPPR